MTDITTDASFLALLKHVRNKLAAKVEAIPPGDERDEEARKLEALAGYVDDLEWKHPQP
jgi:hypothetical protein